MNLVRADWTDGDIADFLSYLGTLSKGEEKAKWEQRIVNTAMPCLAVPSPEVKRIVKQIAKGNYRAFIQRWCWANFTASAILGQLICYLPFEEQVELLPRYAARTDTWAGTDCLTFDKGAPEAYLAYAKQWIASPHTFLRRLGVIVMLKVLSSDTVDEILAALPSLEAEEAYYVNMAVAWLISDCFIKCREETLAFLDRGQYNTFVSRKAVSKCRDSYRVSAEDKQMLLRYRKK